MARDQDLGFKVPHLIEAAHPFNGITIRGSADGVEVRKGLVEVISREKNFPVGQPHHELVVRLSWGVNELQIDTSDRHVEVVFKGVRRAE